MPIIEFTGFQVEGEDKVYATREAAEAAETLQRRVQATTELLDRTWDHPPYDVGASDVVAWLLENRTAVLRVLA